MAVCLSLSACGGAPAAQQTAQPDPAPAAESAEPANSTESSSVIVDPAIANEVHVTSDEPYVMSGDQSYFVED